jgi:hypothetical protein
VRPLAVPATAGPWLLVGPRLDGPTRWTDPAGPDTAPPGSSPQPRFRSTTAVPLADVLAGAREGAPGVGRLVVLCVASVDADWATSPGPDPALPPQSHLVNARVNASWDRTNNGFRVKGRTVFVSTVSFDSNVEGWGGGPLVIFC